MAKDNSRWLKFTVVAVLLLLFLYVFQRVQILRLGYRIRDKERRITALGKDNSIISMRISGLVSPKRIAEETERLGLDLVAPQEKQVIRIKEPRTAI